MIRLWLLSFWIISVLASPTQQPLLRLQGDHNINGWIDPRLNGGRFLDFTTKRYGEPLNVIISSHSDPFILTEDGFQSYSKSIGFSRECLGLHYGNIHDADLGDGDGRKPEQFLARQHYFPVFGTCWESLAGRRLRSAAPDRLRLTHVIARRGTSLQSLEAERDHGELGCMVSGSFQGRGNLFSEVCGSREINDIVKNSRKHHDIVPNGYNLGRDWLVNKAVSGSSWKGIWWKAHVEWRHGLLEEGKKGVNHGIPQDGRVAILTILRD